MSWIERTLGGTRAQLLKLLRRSRRSINELAASAGITDNAVRTHVAAMQRDGMVQAAGVERATGGKPAQLYEITPEAEEMFPKAYAVVLNALIELLEERRGREELIGMLREVGVRAAAAEGGARPDSEARVQAAADRLRKLGGEIEVERLGAGWTLRGYGCPLSSVVAEHENVCALAESLVAAITQLPVRERCEHGARPRCAFEILPAEPTPASAPNPS